MDMSKGSSLAEMNEVSPGLSRRDSFSSAQIQIVRLKKTLRYRQRSSAQCRHPKNEGRASFSDIPKSGSYRGLLDSLYRNTNIHIRKHVY